MGAELVVLRDSNFRDPVATLRKIADAIERGDRGEVTCVGVVLFGSAGIEVFGAGRGSEPCEVTAVLQAGNLFLVNELLKHGKG